MVLPSALMTLDRVALKSCPEDTNHVGVYHKRTTIFMEYSRWPLHRESSEVIPLASLFPLGKQQVPLEVDLVPNAEYKFFLSGDRYVQVEW